MKQPCTLSVSNASLLLPTVVFGSLYYHQCDGFSVRDRLWVGLGERTLESHLGFPGERILSVCLFVCLGHQYKSEIDPRVETNCWVLGWQLRLHYCISTVGRKSGCRGLLPQRSILASGIAYKMVHLHNYILQVAWRTTINLKLTRKW